MIAQYNWKLKKKRQNLAATFRAALLRKVKGDSSALSMASGGGRLFLKNTSPNCPRRFYRERELYLDFDERLKVSTWPLCIYMCAHLMLQYLKYEIWISNVTSRQNLIYWNTFFKYCVSISRYYGWISTFQYPFFSLYKYWRRIFFLNWSFLKFLFYLISLILY